MPESEVQHSAGLEAPALPTRVEIIPTPGIVDAVVAHLPLGTTVTVTCLPHHGIDRTLETALALSDRG